MAGVSSLKCGWGGTAEFTKVKVKAAWVGIAVRSPKTVYEVRAPTTEVRIA
jgi:hypothetical protein